MNSKSIKQVPLDIGKLKPDEAYRVSKIKLDKKPPFIMCGNGKPIEK